MDRLNCDACGRPLLLESDVRYEVSIEAKAAYDPLEITSEDLKKDHRREMAELIRKMDGISEAEAMDQVFRKFRFDLCTPCHRAYLKNPLGPRPATE